MAVYQRTDLPKLLSAIKQGKPCPVFLVVGDSYLCLQVAEQICQALIPDPITRGQRCNLIDGDQEDPLNTLNLLNTYSLFGGGRQIFRVSGSKLFDAKEVAKALWDKAKVAYDKGAAKQVSSQLSRLAAIAKIELTELAGLSEDDWQEAFSFAKPDTAWLAVAVSATAETAAKGGKTASKDPAELYMTAIEAGLPEDNVLILLVEAADKRKKLYKGFVNLGAVIDLTVAAGSTKIARGAQDTLLTDLVRQTLTEFHKTIEGRAIPILLERVGFHPVAVVRETEKLALYVGEASHITIDDLMAVVGRTREEAIFELTEAFAEQDLGQLLLITSRLYHHGYHPLAIVAGLRNQLRKLLLVTSFRQGGPPSYVEGMSFAVFEKGYLVELKSEKGDWLAQLPTHPYALYRMFEKANRYSLPQLTRALSRLLDVELALKSSGLPPLLVLEHFFWQTLSPATRPSSRRTPPP